MMSNVYHITCLYLCLTYVLLHIGPFLSDSSIYLSLYSYTKLNRTLQRYIRRAWHGYYIKVASCLIIASVFLCKGVTILPSANLWRSRIEAHLFFFFSFTLFFLVVFIAPLSTQPQQVREGRAGRGRHGRENTK